MRAFTSLVLPELNEALRLGEQEGLRTIAAELLPGDLVDVCEQLDQEFAARLLTLLDVKQASDVFENFEPDLQLTMIEALGRKRLVAILDDMSPDDRADLVARLPERSAEALLPLLAQAERNDLARLLKYPEETAGGLMTTEYVALPEELTVAQALSAARRAAPDRETIYTIYVVDETRKLRGVVSLRDILIALPHKRLSDIMVEHPVCIEAMADQEHVATVFEKYDFEVAPVVDEAGTLIGIITVDDVLDVLQEEHTEDVQRLGGMEPLDEPYMDSSLVDLIRKRVVWLVLLLFAQNLTALAIDAQEDVLKAVLGLVLFIPFVNSSGGNAGSQSATLVCRALAMGQVRFRDVMWVLRRECYTGFCMGLIVAGVGGFSAWVWRSDPTLAFVVASALVAVVTIGSLLGAFIPLVLDKLGIDPAVSSAPFIASVSDVIGISTYFLIARLILV